jgi:hypothetical protein
LLLLDELLLLESELPLEELFDEPLEELFELELLLPFEELLDELLLLEFELLLEELFELELLLPFEELLDELLLLAIKPLLDERFEELLLLAREPPSVGKPTAPAMPLTPRSIALKNPCTGVSAFPVLELLLFLLADALPLLALSAGCAIVPRCEACAWTGATAPPSTKPVTVAAIRLSLRFIKDS